MPAAVAAFFASLPPWVQATVAIAIALATVIIAWKGVLPHFIHEVPVMHDGVMYFRNRVVWSRTHPGEAKTVGPGHYPQIPGILKYQNTDKRSQTSTTPGFKLDFGTPPTTYNVDGLAITWRVVNAHLYQTGSADSELFVKERTREACRAALMSAADPTLSRATVTDWCRRRTPTLVDVGVYLEDVLITSGSFETRNHRFPDGNLGKTAVTAEEG